MTAPVAPLPAFLAVPDGDLEPVSEASLSWLADQLAADPTVTLEEVLHEAEQVAANPALPPSPGAYPEAARELAEAQAAAQVARWEVDGIGSAQWAMAKLAAVEAEADEIAAQASAWMDEIQRWREARLRPLGARSAFFTDRLTGWLRRLRDADPKVKSQSLPSGTISSRTVPAKIEVVDEEEVIHWLYMAHDDGPADEIVKTVHSVRLTEFRKFVIVDEEAGVLRDPDDGQPVPGVKLAPSGVSYSVKVASGG